ncbi:MarR family winged helix-turn-helix transcriptional regulator [Nocardioides sp. NPDC057577]|uniref:MarR family winged helix-turn-helix transcriptional regulator n=1 Tax=unclassified Nocardioides TaxID=2615069 RepID=UPI00088D40DF|nr:MarR family transcriptional regulator [Nocardioides sp. YR527]SDK80484.1 DNA-binding transcriptional regulator, MarR family [Nocardioides sp. YR527]
MDETADLLMAAARTLRRRFGEATARWGITPSQSRALRIVLAADEPIRLSALAERLRIVPRSATEVVDGLEGHGLVARRPDPADRRAVCVVATEEGVRLGRLIEDARQQAADELLRPLPEEDRATLTRILVTLLDGRTAGR